MQKIHETKLKDEPDNSLTGKAGRPRGRGSADLLAITPAWSRLSPSTGTWGDLSGCVSHLKESAELWCQHNSVTFANSCSPAWNDLLLLNRVTTGYLEGIPLEPATGLVLILPGTSPNRDFSQGLFAWVHLTSFHLPTDTFASVWASNLQHFA